MDEVIERETMEFDVVIVGAGPAGLAAAIRLKQLAAETGKDISVVVLEKGSQVGAHILSGAVIDPVALDRLLPDWREQDSPLQTEVSEDRFYYLTEKSGIGFPSFLMPPLMSNHGCYIGSLGSLCRWLGEQAEALGVEIYPGISVTDAMFGPNGEVEGVITGDMGVARDGTHKDSYTPGIALTGKYTLLAEGARGSLTKQLISRFSLDAESGPQKYGIGLKELWEVPKEKHKPWPRAAHHGLAAARPHRRRLVPLSFRREPGVGRLRRASRLRQSLHQPVQGISARQAASAHRRPSRRRQAHLLWRARADRRRLAGDPAPRLSRRCADRLRCRLHERAAHQGQPQRHALRHDGGGSGVRRDRRRALARRARRLRGSRQGQLHGDGAQESAQRQAAMVAASARGSA